MTRVVIADDQALIRQGIRGLLEVAGIAVVGEAANGSEAVDLVASLQPDVLLLDMRMPDTDGLWALERLRELGDGTPALVLTTFDDDELVLAAVRAGARGFLLKDVTLEQLTSAVAELAAGGTVITPSVTERVMRALRAAPGTPGDSDAAPAVPVTLTEREREVLRLAALGSSNREIASMLFLSEGTVKNHISAIITKLGARDRTSAVLRALRDGLLG